MKRAALVGAGLIVVAAGAAATVIETTLPGPMPAAGTATDEAQLAADPRTSAAEGQTPADTVRWRRPAVAAPLSFEAADPASSDRWAHAFHFNGPIYAHAKADADISGYVRRNGRVPVSRYVGSEGCDHGGWYEVFDRGFVCTGDGFLVGEKTEEIAPELRINPATVEQHLPYRYAKVDLDTRHWASIPDPDAEGTRGAVPSGVHFVAVDDVVHDRGRRFVRTLRGLHHRESDVTWLEPSTMHGERLGEETKLPVAFVIDEQVPLLRLEDGEVERVGSAERFSRFHVAALEEVDGQRLVFADDGLAAPAEHVRIARRVRRPDDIPAGAKWIHVDLDSQTLVAHEGGTPRLATLVSTGTPGHEPPVGVFRVHKRFISRTMSGDDETHGSYEVQQVPWTMYYWGSLAIHGAYWHDEFGRVRSHGCTNVPPADARWLFYWSGPALPPGWHGTVGRLGAYVYTT